MQYLKFKKTKKLNKLEFSILIGLISAIVLCFLNCYKTSENISRNVLRLHILANSNSEQDQALKLKVRDEILKNFNFNSFNNDLEKSKQEINEKIPQIESLAKKTIENEGYSYDVAAKLNNSYFSTREYDGFSMPAGFYDALRIEIGKAEGRNWWCVMVPSMCVPASNKKEEAFETFNTTEKDLLKKGYKTEIRFACVEFFKKIF